MAVNKESLITISMTEDEFLSLTDESMTDEVLADLRFIGAPAPPLVTALKWSRKIGMKEPNARVKRAIHLSALGKTNHEIAEELNYDYSTVCRITSDRDFKARVAHKQSLIFQHDAKGWIKTLMNKAYGTVDEILSDESGDIKASVKLAAAQFVIDHVSGKASQTVEVKGNLLGDLIQELDAMKEVGPGLMATPIEPEYVDVPVEPKRLEEKTVIAKANLAPLKDEMDDLVALLVPDEFTVGKRS